MVIFSDSGVILINSFRLYSKNKILFSTCEFRIHYGIIIKGFLPSVISPLHITDVRINNYKSNNFGKYNYLRDTTKTKK